MKKVLLTLGIALASYCSYAQNTYPWPSTGSIGIGTTSPESGFKLDVNGLGTIGTQGSARLYMGTMDATHALIQSRDNSTNQKLNFFASSYNFNVGNVGIGTDSPLSLLNIVVPVAKTATGGNMVSFLSTNDASNPFGLRTMIYGASAIANRNVTLQTTDYSLADGGNIILQPAAGNTGIGTTNPLSQLDIYHSGVGSGLRVGGVATGTSSDVSVDLYAANSNNVPAYARMSLGVISGSVGGETGYLNFSTINSGSLTEKLRITQTGNVGIGTAIPDEKLTVLGNIHANEVKVDLSVPGPDYVFESDYQLPDLTELKSYVDKNHHLPEIPSAKQIEKQGISLGDMNMKLLKKVEELTLYLIEKDNEIKIERNANQKQQKQINQIKKKLQAVAETLNKK